MKMVKVLLGCALWWSMAILADGKLYTTDSIPVDTPYQRTIVLYENGYELLLVQSSFQKDARELGWVIPLPTVPYIGVCSSDDDNFDTIDRIFWRLAHDTHPTERRWRTLLFSILLLFWPVLLIAYLLTKRRWLRWGLWGATIIILVGIWPSMIVVSKSASKGVSVIKEEQIGAYQARVIQSNNTNALIQWLKQNNYIFSPKDKKIFAQYIAKGWCFVTLKVREYAQLKRMKKLTMPLVLLFKTKRIVYPMTLTGNTDTPLKLLLYVATTHKVNPNISMPIRFAGKNNHYLGNITINVTPKTFTQIMNNFAPSSKENKELIKLLGEFDRQKKQESKIAGFFLAKKLFSNCSYITKFSHLLQPHMMKQDIVFTFAQDNTPYRHVNYSW